LGLGLPLLHVGMSPAASSELPVTCAAADVVPVTRVAAEVARTVPGSSSPEATAKTVKAVITLSYAF
jgi:hypothetical protein